MLSVGRYQLLETLGEGGMGVVYKAFDPLIRRTVAVKLIAARLDDSPELRQRFFSEARAAGQLSHRNIVTIFDLGEDNGHPYFAMEFLEGRNLRVRLQSPEPMNLDRKLEVMSHVCEGLAYAHSKGVTHRDVKPANIFITDAGEVKVLDFGLARLPASDLTHSKTLIGTLNYMSPEQIQGEKTDQRTDIFAVGVVFYETLSMRSPFQADSVAQLLNKILHEEPQPIGALQPGMPSQLSNLVERAMAKAREDRYQSLSELLIDLAECRAIIRATDPGSASRSSGIRDSQVLTIASPSPGSAPRLTPVPGGPVGAGGSGTPPGSVGISGPHAPWLAAAVLALGVLGAGAWFAWQAAVGGIPSGQPQGQSSAARGGAVSDPTTNRGQAEAPPTRDIPTATEPPAGAGAASGTAEADLPRSEATVGRGRREEAGRRRDEAATRRPPPASEIPTTATPGLAEAETARAAARSAMATADSANASELAASTYRAATDSEMAAAELFDRRQFSLATAKSYEASGLFRRAEIEAREEQARRAEQQRLAEQERLAAESRGAGRPAGGKPVPEAAPPASAPPSPLPQADVPPATVPAPTQIAAAEAGIRDLLAKYVDALEARDLRALKRIWPALSGTQERAIRDDFDHARSIAVDLGNPAIDVSNGTGTVTCHRRYSLVTLDGHHLESRNTSQFAVRKNGAAWVIDGVRHDVAR